MSHNPKNISNQDDPRRNIVTGAGTIVVKVGTRVLTDATGRLDQERIASLARQICHLLDSQRKVVLVSSGAVGAGMGQLGLEERPTDAARLQAVAAIGQTALIREYDEILQPLGRRAAQVLLTAHDLDDRTRHLNVRNTLLSLLEFGVVPVINENDTVAVDELVATFGDNDRLAALATNLIQAPLLIILSDVDGLYNGDPTNPDSRVIETVEHVDNTILGYVRDEKTHYSKGGMASKLNAAQVAASSGAACIIAPGRTDDVLPRILTGEAIGTLVLSGTKRVEAFKRWIRYSTLPRGRVVLDAGAAEAVRTNGRSLLAVGIADSDGQFVKGDIVSICDPHGNEFARGLINYRSEELARIRGLRSDQFTEVLGHTPYEEAIHRDNLALMD